MRVIIFVVASSLVVSLAAAQCCPPYWTQFYEGCYRVIGTRRKWQDAENDCKKLSPSGRFAHLASINDYYEQQFVTALCAESLSGYTNDVWIGASDIRVEGQFEWADNSGSFFDYTNWKNGEPNNNGNEDCVNLYNDSGYWNDKPCDESLSYVCEAPL